MALASLSTNLLNNAVSLASEGAVEVDLNWSFLVQIGLFVVLGLVLKPVLFDPMLKLFEEREKRIDGAKKQARDIDKKSENALTEYETAMSKARASANAERDKLRAEGLKAESDILGKVRTQTAHALEDGKKKAQEEAARVREALRADTNALAKDLAARVLGREVQG
jgi:F-type H+-transporting ATPase subunit b